MQHATLAVLGVFFTTIACSDGGGFGGVARRKSDDDKAKKAEASGAQTPPDEDAEGAPADVPQQVSGAFLVACGPTVHKPEKISEDEEAFGCAVLDKRTRRKFEGPVAFQKMQF